MTQTGLFDESRHTQMQRQASDFHAQFPRVWQLFRRFTFERIDRGFAHYSADAIMHRVRWETSAGSGGRGDGFKINSNHVAFYSRRFMRLHPRHEGFFRTRAQTSHRTRVPA